MIDETSDLRKGVKAPEVQRQWCGEVGNRKTAWSRSIRVMPRRLSRLLDGELFLPESWSDDRSRCDAAGIPEDKLYRPKWQIPLALYDRFHIAKYLNEAVDQVRRQEHRQLKSEGDHRLTGTRQTWLFHPENLSESKTGELDALRKQSLQTSRAWGLKDYFRWFWTYADADSARKFFEDWYAWAIRSRLEPVKKVARMLISRLDNILTWFRHPISNGPSEGFNSRIQAIKASARGFRNFGNYRTRILFFCGKLSLKPTLN